MTIGRTAGLLAIGILGVAQTGPPAAEAGETRIREELRERRRLGPTSQAQPPGALSGTTIGVEPPQLAITPPGFYDLSIDGDLDLGGGIFKDGFRFLYGGSAAGGSGLGIDTLLYVTPGVPYETSGTYNTATGKNALRATTSGRGNTALGVGALTANTAGDLNTAVGAFALEGNTLGVSNTAVGAYALASNTTGAANTAAGFAALYTSSEADANTALGARALYSNTAGSYNTGAGTEALYGNQTGSQNVALGHQALRSNTTGSFNVAVGVRSLHDNQTGDANIAIGYRAGYATTGSYNLLIDNEGVAGESGVIRIGDAAVHYQAYVAGVYDQGVTALHAVYVSAAGQLGLSASSRRVKRQIEPMGDASAGLLELEPVSFRYRGERDDRRYGLIAEQVAEVLPELVATDDDGSPVTVLYHQLPPMLVNELQKLWAEDRERRQRLAEHRRELEVQEAMVEELLDRLAQGDSEGSLRETAAASHRRAEPPLSATTSGPGSERRDVIPPGSYAVTIEGDLVLGGYAFKDGDSLFHSDGGAVYGNTALGFRSLQTTIPGVPDASSGYGNTAIGYEALEVNVEGSLSTAIGARALQVHVDGMFNTAIGFEAMELMVSGASNVGAGFQALRANTVGSFNTALGYQALATAATAGSNTALGYGAAAQLAGGDFNLWFGGGAGASVTVGNDNVAIGHDAMQTSYGVETASRNTVVGARAQGRGATDNVSIGFAASLQGATASNSVFLGERDRVADGQIFLGQEGVQTRSFLAGVVGVAVAGSHAVYVDANGQLGQNLSSRRFKEQIRHLGDVGDRLSELRPVTFRYRGKEGLPRRYGLIAEEVASVFPELVTHDRDGAPRAVLDHQLAPLLVAEIQAIAAARRAQGFPTALDADALRDRRIELVRLGERAGRLSTTVREVAHWLRPFLPERPLVAPTTGAGLEGPSKGIVLEADLEIGGYLFKDGAPFLHNDPGKTSRNTSLGRNALVSQDAMTYGANTAIGASALTSATTAGYNSAVGAGAQLSRQTGFGNDAAGLFALGSATTGDYSVAMGAYAMGLATPVYGQVAIGAFALNQQGPTAENNAAHGFRALNATTEGIENSALGVGALSGNTTGSSNTAAGALALASNTTGARNTAVGGRALYQSTTGSRNIAVGFNAGYDWTVGNDNIAVGNAGVADESTTLRIGAVGTHTNTFVAGVLANMVVGVHAASISAEGQLGLAMSTRRAKADIRPVSDVARKLAQLRPVTYVYREDADRGVARRRYGLIAEEVADVFPELVVRDADGRPHAVLYRQLLPLLLKELQRLRHADRRWQQVSEQLGVRQRELSAATRRLRALLVALEEQDAATSAPRIG